MAAKKTLPFALFVAMIAIIGVFASKYYRNSASPSESGPMAQSEPKPKLKMQSQNDWTAYASEYKCQSAPSDCVNTPYLAETDEEAMWLFQHGYPTSRQLERLRTKSTAQYKDELLKTNSQVARSLYGMSLAEDGETRAAIGVLGEGAKQGNLFALYALSTIYGKSDSVGNLSWSASYQRLAYLAGDSKAGDAYARKFAILTPPEHAIADREAATLHKKLLGGRVFPRP